MADRKGPKIIDMPTSKPAGMPEAPQAGNVRKKYLRRTVLLIIGVCLLFIISGSFFLVEEYEYGVVYRMGRIVSVIDEAGLFMKIPIVDSVKKVNNRYIIHDLPPSDVITLDKKNMEVDTLIIWRIVDPLQMTRTLSNQFEAENRIEANVYGDIKKISGRLTQDKILTDRKDNALDNMILEESQKNINKEQYGIEIVDIQIQRFDFPTDNKESIIERMISEREQIVSSYQAEGKEEAQKILNKSGREEKLIITEAQSESAKIRAQGDSEYMRIMSTAYNTPEKEDFYELIIAYDMIKNSITRGQTLILDKDSELAEKILGYGY